MFDQAIIALALFAGILSKYDHRQAGLAFCYALTVAIFTLFASDPGVFSHVGYAWWFVACACGEAAIIMWAWIWEAPASPYIAILSTINMIQHLFLGFEYKFLHSTALYSIYHELVPMVEGMQIVALYLFSWPCITLIRWYIHKHYQERKPPWIQRMSHSG